MHSATQSPHVRNAADASYRDLIARATILRNRIRGGGLCDAGAAPARVFWRAADDSLLAVVGDARDHVAEEAGHAALLAGDLVAHGVFPMLSGSALAVRTAALAAGGAERSPATAWYCERLGGRRLPTAGRLAGVASPEEARAIADTSGPLATCTSIGSS